MVISEITLVTNQANEEGMQSILQQMAGVLNCHLSNQRTDVMFDPLKIHYDRILEETIQAGYRVIWFYVIENEKSWTLEDFEV